MNGNTHKVKGTMSSAKTRKSHSRGKTRESAKRRGMTKIPEGQKEQTACDHNHKPLSWNLGMAAVPHS